jgi:hypothetical protein
MADINELDMMAHELKVRWRKANNYYRSFTTMMFQTKDKFAHQAYGMPFSSWFLRKAGLSEDQVMRQLKVFLRIIAAEDRERVERENYRIDAEHRAEKRAAREALRRDQEAAKATRDAAKAERDAEKAESKAQRDAQRIEVLTRALFNLPPRSDKITDEVITEITRLCGKTDKPQGLVRGETAVALQKKYKIGRTAWEEAIGETRGRVRRELELLGVRIADLKQPERPKPLRGGRKRRSNMGRMTAAVTTLATQPAVTTVSLPNDDLRALTDAELAAAVVTAVTCVKNDEAASMTLREVWIKDTMMLVTLIGEARRRYPSDPQIGKWRRDNLGKDIISDDDFTALGGMARDLTATQAKLEALGPDDSWSWREIWKEMSSYSRNVAGVDPDGSSEPTSTYH